MTKKDFVTKFAEKMGAETKVEAEKKVNAFLDVIEESLIEGEEINFIGWGKFEVVEKAARKGRNPKTGQKIDIPAKKSVKFKAGKKLADKVNA